MGNSTTKKLLVVSVLLILLFIVYFFGRTESLTRNAEFKTERDAILPSPTSKAQETPEQPQKINDSNIFNLINVYRAKNGKPPLAVSDKLCELAQLRASLFAQNLEVALENTKSGAHWRGNEQHKKQIRSVGWAGQVSSENIAINPDSDLDVLEIWKRTPGHNETVLMTEYQRVPVIFGCISVAKITEDKTYYFEELSNAVVVLLVGDK